MKVNPPFLENAKDSDTKKLSEKLQKWVDIVNPRE